MLLLLLLVTPLVNAGDNSCSTPCMCTLPEPLEAVNSTQCLNGLKYGKYRTANRPCSTVTRMDTGDNTFNISLTETTENGCSQTIVTYYGTVILAANNTLVRIYPCKPEWNGDLVILATDCKTYVIYGRCAPGSCKPDYNIRFSSDNPSDCTMKKVKKDLNCLGLCLDDFPYTC